MEQPKIVDLIVDKSFYLAKCSLYGGLIGALSLSLFLLGVRFNGWLSTGMIQHSTESAHMQASETVRVLADVWVALIYGGIAGIILGLVVGIVILIVLMIRVGVRKYHPSGRQFKSL